MRRKLVVNYMGALFAVLLVAAVAAQAQDAGSQARQQITQVPETYVPSSPGIT